MVILKILAFWLLQSLDLSGPKNIKPLSLYNGGCCVCKFVLLLCCKASIALFTQIVTQCNVPPEWKILRLKEILAEKNREEISQRCFKFSKRCFVSIILYSFTMLPQVTITCFNYDWTPQFYVKTMGSVTLNSELCNNIIALFCTLQICLQYCNSLQTGTVLCFNWISWLQYMKTELMIILWRHANLTFLCSVLPNKLYEFYR